MNTNKFPEAGVLGSLDSLHGFAALRLLEGLGNDGLTWEPLTDEVTASDACIFPPGIVSGLDTLSVRSRSHLFQKFGRLGLLWEPITEQTRINTEVKRGKLLPFPNREGEPKDFAITAEEFKKCAKQRGLTSVLARTLVNLDYCLDPDRKTTMEKDDGTLLRVYSWRELQRITAKPRGRDSILASYPSIGDKSILLVKLTVGRKTKQINAMKRKEAKNM